MRWLFLFLLVLNAGYLAWELNRDRQPQSMQYTVPRGVERIVLLEELEREQPAETVAQVNDTALQPQADEKSGAAATPAAAVASETTGAAPVEVASLNSSAAAPGGEEPAVAAENEPAVDRCYTLGPFSEMKTLRLVTREIKDYVIEASFRSREEQEQSMFRVYLKPVGSKREARELIKELVSNNIRDYFIITDGPNKNGISLGYFSNKGRAYRHAERVRKLGFDAIAEPVFRTYTIYWLDYRIKAGNEIPRQIFDQHLENSAQKLSRSCN
ncbi:MAG: hypothetical protein PVG45_12395 [Gammaproteobacteria bacterium]|jgi:hypothetical protein